MQMEIRTSHGVQATVLIEPAFIFILQHIRHMYDIHLGSRAMLRQTQRETETLPERGGGRRRDRQRAKTREGEREATSKDKSVCKRERERSDRVTERER